MPKQNRKAAHSASKKRQKISREKPLSLAPLTAEEAIKRMFGVDPTADKKTPHSAREEVVNRIAEAIGDALRTSKRKQRNKPKK